MASYGTLCAEYYHLDKPSAPPEAAEWYLKRARESGGPILEPMCGTGRFLIPMKRAGFEVVGFDRSAAMLARCPDPSLDLLEGSWDLPLEEGKFPFIFIPAGSIGHLEEEKLSELFSSVSRWLAPGGRFLFEVETLNAIGLVQQGWQGRWVTREDGAKIVLSTLSQLDSTKQAETTLFRYEVWKESRIVATEVEELCMRYYTLDEIDQLLGKHPLQVVQRYAGYTTDIADSTTQFAIYECKGLQK